MVLNLADLLRNPAANANPMQRGDGSVPKVAF